MSFRPTPAVAALIAAVSLGACGYDGPAPATASRRVLVVEGTGAGGATIISSPGGIDCRVADGVERGDCHHAFGEGIIVTLTATPEAGSVIAEWEGAECIVGDCAVAMTRDRGLTVTVAPIESIRWLSFAPTGFDPERSLFPSEASLRTDLELALGFGFEGVLTFAADGTLHHIPRIARELGFRGVIMGLFLRDEGQREIEIPNALAAAPFVDGYGVGNEGLIGCGGNLYTNEVLVATMDEIRRSTGKPVSTSEQIEDYIDGGGCLDGFLRDHGDWLFPIVHPFNHGIRDPEVGATFTLDRLEELDDLSGAIVCAKETGWPTGGHPAATEQNQRRYFELLEGAQLCSGYFEFADQAWKTWSPVEPFWGLVRADRTPKLFLTQRRR